MEDFPPSPDSFNSDTSNSIHSIHTADYAKMPSQSATKLPRGILKKEMTRHLHAYVSDPSEESSKTPGSWNLDAHWSDVDEDSADEKMRAHRKHKKAASMTNSAPAPAPAPACVCSGAGAIPVAAGPQIYVHNNPVCIPNVQDIPQLLPHPVNNLSNQAYSGQPHIGYGQPIATQYQLVQLADQVSLSANSIPDTNIMDGNYIYQNQGSANGQIHFQPQNTSMGPMIHQQLPISAGQLYMTAHGMVPHSASGPLHAGMTTIPMQPMAVMRGQPLPGQQMYVGAGGNMTAGQQPMMMHMPGGGLHSNIPAGQPVLLGSGSTPMMPGAYPIRGLGAPMAQDQSGLGQLRGIEDPKLSEPQEFVPADPDPSRMYKCRQLDGNYVSMSRATIDSFGKAARWYITGEGHANPGVFYAVRLDY